MEQSHFFRLPAELRTEIYRQALYRPEGLTIRVLTGKPQICKERNGRHVLALPSTCRQLRQECSPFVYELNKFNLIARPPGQRYNPEIWQRGLHAWLDQIGERGRARLFDVEIDIGTSFMYDLYPTCETLWRSVSSLLYLFNRENARVSMKTEVCWMSQACQSFPISIPLNNSTLARQAVAEALSLERRNLDNWVFDMRVSPRVTSYRVMELANCGQELRSFIALLDQIAGRTS